MKITNKKILAISPQINNHSKSNFFDHFMCV
jgi:hypothetical protein